MELIERDDAGNVTVTYIESHTSGKEPATRVDISSHIQGQDIRRTLAEVFLPAGYPHSVTKDYLDYQIYDSLQAFASSIAGLLSSRAVLQGVGVGDAAATPTAALLYSVLQESTGRIATILFAHKYGVSLEAECKMYRLAADVFNDTAMMLDCLSPVLPKAPKVLLLSFSSALRALCGVAAGSSKASLSAHFARWGNLGELNAKDSSQETIISLTGMLAGSLVVARVSSPTATWLWLITLLSVHLLTNYAAVRSVKMRTLNRQRANLVWSSLFDDGVLLNPEQVAQQERIFERNGVLRWKGSIILGYAEIGVSLQELLVLLGVPDPVSRAVKNPTTTLAELEKMYEEEDYILWYDRDRQRALIVLKERSPAVSQLKAWAHALLVAKRMEDQSTPSPKPSLELGSTSNIGLVLQETLRSVNATFNERIESLRQTGWDLDTAALVTRPGFRISRRTA